MCGLCGVYRFGDAPATAEDRARVAQMGEVQRHRGPDDRGLEAFGPCVLGSQRLSILDLSPQGHMPMCSEDGSLALVHNGEVYNYLELRAELETLGRRFRSEGDTEVILRAYQQWGADCTRRFVGMWAFALYDARTHTLVLSRDRFGIKPLYLHQTEHRLLFASEVKALVDFLRREGAAVRVNEASLATYAATGQVDGQTDTFVQGIWRFPAAHSATAGPGGLKLWRYWDLPQAAQAQQAALTELSDGQVFQRVEATLDEAVRVHLRSDVPVGVCLSGGLDSSAVVGLASRHVPRVKTFTVYFADGPDFDERQHSTPVAQRFGADAREKLVQPDDLLASLRQIIWHLDEPAAALGVYPQWHVMELAHHDVKVVLDGQGGDEVFAGYTNYLPQHLYGLLAGNPLRFAREVAATGRLHGWARARTSARSAVAMRARQPRTAVAETLPDAALLAPELRPLADASMEEWRLWPRVFDDWLTNVLYWELTRTRLPALLRYEDRLSMAFSVESRVPFLDHRLVELAFALPGTMKVRDGWSKYALRKALAGLLPAPVVWRRDKKGFPTPVGRWLHDERGQPARDLLRESGRRSARYFPTEALHPHLAAHERGQADRSWQLWRALSVELWMEAYGL